ERRRGGAGRVDQNRNGAHDGRVAGGVADPYVRLERGARGGRRRDDVPGAQFRYGLEGDAGEIVARRELHLHVGGVGHPQAHVVTGRVGLRDRVPLAVVGPHVDRGGRAVEGDAYRGDGARVPGRITYLNVHRMLRLAA